MGPLVSQLRGFGLAFTPEQIEKTRNLYAPHVPRPDGSRVTRNIQYATHGRNLMDMFYPTEGVTDAPVVVFVHGGGFVQGDKGAPDNPFFNNVGAWAANNGFVGVTMTYRYAPEHKWPAGAEDVAAAVRVLRQIAPAAGGDPDKIVLIGHSAGGAHVGAYIGHPDLKAEAARSLKGAVLISAIHDVEHADHNDFQKAYYGEDPAAWPGQSSVPGLAETDIPLLLTLSEFDPPEFHRLAALVVDARARAKSAWPAFFWMEGHNHVSPSMQIGTAEDSLGPRIVAAMTGPNGWLAA